MKSYSPQSIASLPWWRGFCVSVIPGAVPSSRVSPFYFNPNNFYYFNTQENKY